MSSVLFQAQGSILEFPAWREDDRRRRSREPTCPPGSGCRGTLGWGWGHIAISIDNAWTLRDDGSKIKKVTVWPEDQGGLPGGADICVES